MGAELGNQPPVNDRTDEQPGATTDRPSLVEWQRRLNTSPGGRAVALMDRVQRIGYVFQGNVAQYKSLVASLHDPKVASQFLDVRNPAAHDQLLSEAERLLHNVLTAMSTRVDQQRNFMRKHFGDDAVMTMEYDERISVSFGESPQAKFLKGLRNYITHRQLPVAQSRQTIGPNSLEVTFTLSVEPLLSWDSWNAEMREWIAAYGDAVEIVDVVDTYARMAGGFDKWLFERIRLKYAADIDALAREEREFNREHDRVFGF